MPLRRLTMPALAFLAACQPMPGESPPGPAGRSGPGAAPPLLATAPVAAPAAAVAPTPVATAAAIAPTPVATAADVILPPIAGPPAGSGPMPPQDTEIGPPGQSSVQLAGRPFFCATIRPLPGPPPYCTRSLGQVDCWTRPPLAIPARPGLADGRMDLTAAQEARRNQCWPGLF